LLLLEPVRSLVISFGEFCVGRPLTHLIWHEHLIGWAIEIFIVYCICTFLFSYVFQNNILIIIFRFAILGITAFFVFLILFHANYTFSDDHGFIKTIAVNKFIPVHVYLSIGRFNPLGYMDYNALLFLFRLFGVTTGVPVIAQYLLIALYYVISIVFLYLLFQKQIAMEAGNSLYCYLFFLCLFPLTATSILAIFMRIIFFENIIILFFCCFMLTYFYAIKTKKIKYYIIAFLAAIYATYLKEPVFVSFLIIALTNLLFRFKNMDKKEKFFYYGLTLNAVIFLLLYYFIVYRNVLGFYNEGRVADSILRIIVSIFKDTKILIIVFLLGFIRAFFILVKKDKAHLFYDSLIFASMGYVTVYIFLRLNASYYFTPAVILAFPALAYYMSCLYKKKKLLSLALFIPVTFICLLNFNSSVPIVKYSIIDNRKTFMPYIHNLLFEYNSAGNFIWYESNNALTENTFYKDARNWRKFIINAFLNYAGNTTGKDFFTVYTDFPQNKMPDGNFLFFYAVDNDQWQPMPDLLAQQLDKEGFKLFTSSYGVLIYMKNINKAEQ
jgi:hypothetical protein